MRIGIDIGGTKIAGGIVDDDGNVVRRAEVATCADQGKEFVLDQLRIVIDMLARGRRVDGIGIGVPGRYRGTVIIELPHVPALDGVDLARELHAATAVVLENDARCFALAEWKHGAARDMKNAIGVIIGTGVGGGIIIDGKPFSGADGGAGEIGHQICDLSCASFSPGSGRSDWESLLSGPAIVRRHKERGGVEGTPAAIWVSPSSIAAQTRDGTLRLLAIFIANLQGVFDPEAIVLGGGVSNLPLVEPVNALLPRYGGRPIVAQNALGKDAGIVGAVVALNMKRTPR